jgi:integrase
VDLDGKTAVISQQLQQYDGRLAVCPPKTPHSVRVIALDRTTIAALPEHRHRQRAEAAAYGPGYRDSGYVFTCLNGDPMAPDRLTRTFKKLTALAGLPPIRLHDFRHGAARRRNISHRHKLSTGSNPRGTGQPARGSHRAVARRAPVSWVHD